MRQALLTVLVAFAAAAESGLGPVQSAPTPTPTPAPTLEELERTRALQKIEAQIDELQALGDRMVNERALHCMQAVGSRVFCDCLRRELPIGASFKVYVQIVTSTKGELGYSDLSSDYRTMVDMTRAARDVCVAEVFE